MHPELELDPIRVSEPRQESAFFFLLVASPDPYPLLLHACASLPTNKRTIRVSLIHSRFSKLFAFARILCLMQK